MYTVYSFCIDAVRPRKKNRKGKQERKKESSKKSLLVHIFGYAGNSVHLYSLPHVFVYPFTTFVLHTKLATYHSLISFSLMQRRPSKLIVKHKRQRKYAKVGGFFIIYLFFGDIDGWWIFRR